MDSRVLLAEVRESEDWSPVTNSRSLGTAWEFPFGELRGGPVGWSWGGFWGGEVTDKHKNGRFFGKLG